MSAAPARLPAKPVIAIVGATGAVGVEILSCIENASFPTRRSARSRRLVPREAAAVCRQVRDGDGAHREVVRRRASRAVLGRQRDVEEIRADRGSKGAVVVDNSSAFRMDDGDAARRAGDQSGAMANHPGIIANPNCAAIISITPLWPIHKVNPHQAPDHLDVPGGLGRGRGRDGRAARIHARLSRRPRVPAEGAAASVCVQSLQPQHEDGSGDRLQRGRDEGDRRSAQDLRRAGPRVSATCVRVPVLRAHCVSLTFECERPITPDEVRKILATAPGVKIVDDVARNYFPMPKDATGQDDVLVGRIRKDLSDPQRQVDLAVLRRRPAAEGRCAECGADRRTVAEVRLSLVDVLAPAMRRAQAIRDVHASVRRPQPHHSPWSRSPSKGCPGR